MKINGKSSENLLKIDAKSKADIESPKTSILDRFSTILGSIWGCFLVAFWGDLGVEFGLDLG